jgi:hypothetical protein
MEELWLKCNMHCPCRNCGELAIQLILHKLAIYRGTFEKKKEQKSTGLVQYTTLPMQCNNPKK